MLVSRKSLSGRVFALLVFLQAALIVTGGAVRVTGSGLGCPTWPECTPGSYTPVPRQADGALPVSYHHPTPPPKTKEAHPADACDLQPTLQAIHH